MTPMTGIKFNTHNKSSKLTQKSTTIKPVTKVLGEAGKRFLNIWDNMQKVSEMMIVVGGDLLKQAGSLDEMQAHLEMVKHALNISLNSEKKKKAKLTRFIESQKPYAPNKEDLIGLEWEYKRIMKQKETLYSPVKSKIVIAEAVEKGCNNREN
jgi:hypothetical protein